MFDLTIVVGTTSAPIRRRRARRNYTLAQAASSCPSHNVEISSQFLLPVVLHSIIACIYLYFSTPVIPQSAIRYDGIAFAGPFREGLLVIDLPSPSKVLRVIFLGSLIYMLYTIITFIRRVNSLATSVVDGASCAETASIGVATEEQSISPRQDTAFRTPSLHPTSAAAKAPLPCHVVYSLSDAREHDTPYMMPTSLRESGVRGTEITTPLPDDSPRLSSYPVYDSREGLSAATQTSATMYMSSEASRSPLHQREVAQRMSLAFMTHEGTYAIASVGITAVLRQKPEEPVAENAVEASDASLMEPLDPTTPVPSHRKISLGYMVGRNRPVFIARPDIVAADVSKDSPGLSPIASAVDGKMSLDRLLCPIFATGVNRTISTFSSASGSPSNFGSPNDASSLDSAPSLSGTSGFSGGVSDRFSGYERIHEGTKRSTKGSRVPELVRLPAIATLQHDPFIFDPSAHHASYGPVLRPVADAVLPPIQSNNLSGPLLEVLPPIWDLVPQLSTTPGSETHRIRSQDTESEVDGASDSELADDNDDDDSSEDYLPHLVNSNTGSNYVLHGLIGTGSSGRVFWAERQDGEAYAVKVIYKAKNYRVDAAREYLLREKAIMQKITETRAPFLVGLIESWDDEENIFYVMRLYPQTLRDRMSCRPRMTRCQTRYHIAEMVIALHWLHTNGIVHRDIKPENILMTPRGHLVIGDYGLSRMVPDGTPVSEWRIERECAGSPGYSAPEVISSPYTYGIMADVYSLGLVSAEMASRRITPYFVCRTASEQLAMMKKQYRDGEFIPDNGLQIEDEHEKDLVLKTLKWDPSQRPTTAELKVHPYFDGIDWAMLNLRRYQVDVVPTTVKLSEEYPSYDFFTFKQGKDKTAYYGEDVEYDKHRHILPNNAVKAQLGEDRAKQVEYRYLCPAPLRHDDLHGHCTLDPPSPAGCP